MPDLRRPQYKIFAIIFMMSIIFGIAIGGYVYFTDYIDVAGAGLLLSRGFAGGIVMCTMILMFFISFEMIT